MAERSYPTSEVRGSGRECQAAMVQEWPRGATPRPRSGVTAESARLRQRRSSQEELPHVGGQGWWLGGATPHLRPGAAAGRSNPTSKERWLRGRRRASRSYPTFKVRRGIGEEILLVQGVRSSGFTLLEQL